MSASFFPLSPADQCSQAIPGSPLLFLPFLIVIQRSSTASPPSSSDLSVGADLMVYLFLFFPLGPRFPVGSVGCYLLFFHLLLPPTWLKDVRVLPVSPLFFSSGRPRPRTNFFFSPPPLGLRVPSLKTLSIGPPLPADIKL